MRRIHTAVAVALTLPLALAAQDRPTVIEIDSTKPRQGSEVRIPLGSAVLPGLGQYLLHAPKTGLAYTTLGVGGAVLGTALNATEELDMPRSWRGQLADHGWAISTSAGFLSGWDAFHRELPKLHGQGKYMFLGKRESVGQLLSAPFDPRFLGRWTTWVDIVQTATIATLVLRDRDATKPHYPFLGRDAEYAGFIALNAAAGEEALFRGYLLPMLYQKTGRKFWLANATQAATFGALHLPGASWFAAEIGAWALWEGWLVRRNDWSIRESVFHHFWYDAVIITAVALSQERTMRITFPTIQF